MNPLPSGVFDGQDPFLGVRVEDNPERTPRLRVTSVPYAMRATDAGLLGGLPPGAFAEEGPAHEFADLVGVVPEGSLPDSVVLSAELTDILGGYGTVTTFNAGLAGQSDVGRGHAVGDVAGLQAAAEGWALGGASTRPPRSRARCPAGTRTPRTTSPRPRVSGAT